MRRTIVTVNAFHIEIGGGSCRIGRVGAYEASGLSGGLILVFDPWNGLSRRIGGGKPDVDSRAKVRTVNSRDAVSTDQHQKDGLRTGILFVLSVLGEYAQAYSGEPLWPMAVLAGLASRDKTVAFNRGRNGLRAGFKYGFDKLPDSAGLAADPTGCPRSDVAFDTFHPGMR